MPVYVFILKIILIVFLCYYFFKYEVKRNLSFAFTGLLFYIFFSQYFSVLFLESFPIYITESRTYSGNIGARYRILSYFLIIIFTGAIIGRKSLSFFEEKERQIVTKTFNPNVPIFIIILIILAQYLNLILSDGLPLFQAHVDRWNFWSDYSAFPIFEKFFGVLMAFLPFPLFILYRRSNKKKHKYLIVFLTFAHVLFLLITGQRVNGFVWLTCLMIGFLVIKNRIYRRDVLSISVIVKFSILFFLLIYLYTVHMSKSGLANAVGSSTGLVLYRLFVLNGHVYWNLDNLALQNIFSQEPFWDFLNGATSVRILLGGDLGKSFVDKGVNFTGVFPGISVHTLGYYGTYLICLLYGILVGAVNYICLFIIRHKMIYHSFLVGYLWLWTYNFISNGSLAIILSPKYLLVFGILITSVFLKIQNIRLKI